MKMKKSYNYVLNDILFDKNREFMFKKHSLSNAKIFELIQLLNQIFSKVDIKIRYYGGIGSIDFVTESNYELISSSIDIKDFILISLPKFLRILYDKLDLPMNSKTTYLPIRVLQTYDVDSPDNYVDELIKSIKEDFSTLLSEEEIIKKENSLNKINFIL
jgi:hypothetical protein